MLTMSRWKMLGIILVCLAGLGVALPQVLPEHVRSLLPSWWAVHRVPLGLDLKGGVHLVLEVDMATVERDRLATAADQVRSALRKARVPLQRLDVEKSCIVLQVRHPSDQDQATKVVAEAEPDLEQVHGESSAGRVLFRWRPSVWAVMQKNAVSQSVEILRRRVDASGTLEPVIMPQGDRRIVLQLPGVADTAHVKAMLGRTAKLTLRWVESPLVSRIEGVPPPAGSEWLPVLDRAGGGDGKAARAGWYAVNRRVVLTGDMLQDAQPSFDENNQPEIMFRFNTAGARKFGEATAENVGRVLAFVLDQEVINAPVIREPIPGGRGVIQGNFTVQEASDVSLLLRSGALPAPLVPVEERVIGPDLGADSIQAGTWAAVWAVLAVCLFMAVVYGGFGMIANLAVLFNVTLLLAGMSLIQATLTLPGIAGIALTVGMAVDANVLIYERMKEEWRKKQSVPAVVDAGYSRAMATIIDSNVTTLFGTVLLYIFGTGPVRGFAVTLTMGILVSMFTSISLTRMVVILWLRRRRRTSLPLGWWF